MCNGTPSPGNSTKFGNGNSGMMLGRSGTVALSS
jgi:hypothetical protein